MTEPARRGRPRNEAVQAAILAAAVDELVAKGFAGLTIEGVAAGAGVAKTTIYRRWSSAEELALDAMRTFEQDVREPPPGSVRDQLVWLVDGMRRKWNDPRYRAIMRRVTADGIAHPEAYRRARDQLVAPHLALLNAALRRGVDEGLVRADLDIDWLRQLITAPITAATLTFRDKVGRPQIEATVDIVLRGAAPEQA
jgi:AcrR family transcriptional regulator